MALRIVTASSNVARDNHWEIPSGSSTPVRTLLLEHQRIQPAYSNDFSNAVYTKEQTTTTGSMAGITAPDGTQTAWILRETIANNVHGIVRESSTTSNSNWGFGVFVKPLNRYHIRLYVYGDSGTAGYVHFDLNSTGSYTISNGSATITSARMEDYGDGWWKLSTFWRIPAFGTQQAYLRMCTDTSTVSYVGSTGSGAYIWGWNTQDSSGTNYPTSPISSYISSSATTATRENEFLTFLSQSGAPQESTIYVRGISVAPASNGGSSIVQLGTYALSNAMLGIRANASQVIGYFDQAGGTVEVTSTTTSTTVLSPGNQVELLLQFSGSRQVQLFHTIASGSIVTSSLSSAAAGSMPTAWGASPSLNDIQLAQSRAASNPNLSFAYQNILVAKGMKSMQEMRNLAGVI